MRPVLVIGDCIIDEVHTASGEVQRHPGGAALNLAVGLSRLGQQATLLTRTGNDMSGYRIMRELREEGVDIINGPNPDFTGVAISERKDGEPSYQFSPSMFRRRITFTQKAYRALVSSSAIAVNSYSFGDIEQADNLMAALFAAPGFRFVDPNPRPNLIRDLNLYRKGFEQCLRAEPFVKLSDEDAILLYGTSGDEVALNLFGLGAETVLLTRGADGAVVYMRTGDKIAVPATKMEAPIVDTMGAGDATLASVITFVLHEGSLGNANKWRRCLETAMDIAAETCRHAGGGLVLPSSYPKFSLPAAAAQ